MQYLNKNYDPKIHDKFKALTVKQPYASLLVSFSYRDENDISFAIKSVEVRSRPTKYRGDLLICSSKSPVYPGLKSGATLGFAELYKIKRIEDFTDEDWEKTRIPKDKRSSIKKGYGWFMRNPRKVIEFPIKGQLGIYNLIYTKDKILEYPKNVLLDK